MSLVLKSVRNAHQVGNTGVCYFSGRKGGLITWGADGNIIMWKFVEDENSTVVHIAEKITVVLAKKEKIYVGTAKNSIIILNHPELQQQDILARFSSPITALASHENSNFIVCGLSGSNIKLINITNAATFELEGHQALILGLSLDPKDEYMASSSGDGTIKVWNIESKKLIKSWNHVVPYCDSISNANVCCTPSFETHTGEYLALPFKHCVHIMQRDTWIRLFKLESGNNELDMNICRFSDCGELLAACSTTGEIIVWYVASQEQIGRIRDESRSKITALDWKVTESNEILYGNALGQFGYIHLSTISMETVETKTENVETLIARLEGSMKSVKVGMDYVELVVKSSDEILIKEAKDLLHNIKIQHEKVHRAVHKKIALLNTSNKIDILQKIVTKSFKLINNVTEILCE